MGRYCRVALPRLFVSRSVRSMLAGAAMTASVLIAYGSGCSVWFATPTAVKQRFVPTGLGSPGIIFGR